MTMAAVDEADFNLWLDAVSDTLEIREMAIQVHSHAQSLLCFTFTAELAIGFMFLLKQ